MTLNRNPENFFAQIEQAAFEPSALVPGIGFSPDKMLLGRAFAYADTHRHRIGPNYLQLPGQPAPGRGEHLHPGRRRWPTSTAATPRSTPRTPSVAGTPTRSVRSTTAGRPTAPWSVRPTRCVRTTTTSARPGTLVREVWDDEIREAFVKTVAGHLLGGVEGDVLERAFEYWKSVDADTGKKIEELVRQGIDAGAPGAQPGEAKEDASSPIVEDRTHADKLGGSGTPLILGAASRGSAHGRVRHDRPGRVPRPTCLGAPYTAETLELRPRRRGRGRRDPGPPPGDRTADAARRCCTSTGSATTSSRPWRPTSGCAAATTSTPSTCASTAARCGRTRPRTTSPTCATYYEELDLAFRRVIARSTTTSSFSAHSTGGLTVPLWLHDRAHRPAGVFLNAPWLDMHGDAFAAPAGMPAIHQLGAAAADAADPAQRQRRLRAQPAPRPRRRVGLRPGLEAGGSGRCTPAGSARSDAGRPGSQRGLDVDAPVLLVSSTRSGHPSSVRPDLRATDVVLDVERMRRRAAHKLAAT